MMMTVKMLTSQTEDRSTRIFLLSLDTTLSIANTTFLYVANPTEIPQRGLTVQGGKYPSSKKRTRKSSIQFNSIRFKAL